MRLGKNHSLYPPSFRLLWMVRFRWFFSGVPSIHRQRYEVRWRSGLSLNIPFGPSVVTGSLHPRQGGIFWGSALRPLTYSPTWPCRSTLCLSPFSLAVLILTQRYRIMSWMPYGKMVVYCRYSVMVFVLQLCLKTKYKTMDITINKLPPLVHCLK